MSRSFKIVLSHAEYYPIKWKHKIFCLSPHKILFWLMNIAKNKQGKTKQNKRKENKNKYKPDHH